jgi:uncharacterized RDD family membrane protein YckC
MENVTLDKPLVAKPLYASFWLRLVALIIDYIIIYIVHIFVVLPILSMFGIVNLVAPTDLNEENSIAFLYDMAAPLLIASTLTLFISWFYYASFESGSRQATPGKLTVGLIVTDLEGGRITFLQATARFFSKIISSLIFYIGYLIAAFTAKNQALHDIIAGTLVLAKK